MAASRFVGVRKVMTLERKGILGKTGVSRRGGGAVEGRERYRVVIAMGGAVEQVDTKRHAYR